MGSIFSPSPPPPPPPPPPLPTRDDPEVREAERRERLAAARRRGRRATILTGGRGVEGEALVGRPAPGPAPRTLLGQ